VDQPQIISIGYTVPECSYSQQEIFSALRYPSKYRRIFTGGGIEKRHFSVPLEELMSLSWQQQQDRYIEQATMLSEKAARLCLEGRDPADIGCLVFCSCTGFAPGPTIAHYLAQRLGLPPTVYFANIIGQGCESGFPGLKRAADFTIANSKQALVVNCELASLTYFPEPLTGDERIPDPENHWELLRSNSLFGDAAAAVLVGSDDDWRHPLIIHTETHTNFDYLGDLGYTWRDGRLRVLLSRRVPELAPKVVGPAVLRALAYLGMPIESIDWWVIHAAGDTVLDNIRDALGLDEDQIALSRETMSRYGNTSSTSVGITGKRLMEENIKPHDTVAMLSVGPGMTGGCTILQFGGK